MTEPSGTTVKDVPAQAFIEKYAQHLKRQGKMEIPKWVDVVKTGTQKELAPYSPDWYYIRAASIARRIYMRPHAGVGALCKWYGSRERRGVKTEHYHKAASGLIRHILIQLELIKVLEKDGKGRIISRIGQQDLDRIAGQLKEEEVEEDEDEDDDDDDDDDDDESEEESEEESSDEDSD
ncbi:40S ribosomal protein S19 [Hondaea fermentalgiana]|uniref:40S ribosomal protein S19 n=1 Tax=Hondaea fermentalgiana TaxID=2315210 RepID=A0A2R5GUH8_9STRA|nr:40S ribosomal protein S19 [Hondaea fermentalgiana]|eukprot:GBG31544.1 40S ribosomal protein S19 [Hondaea fermentalgiana]